MPNKNRQQCGNESDKQISQNIRDRMKGEHSLQVDQDGASFRGHEKAEGATVWQYQQGPPETAEEENRRPGQGQKPKLEG